MRTRCCSTSRGITADLVESVADHVGDGRDQNLGVKVGHGMVVTTDQDSRERRRYPSCHAGPDITKHQSDNTNNNKYDSVSPPQLEILT